jgi:hypothetical protein
MASLKLTNLVLLVIAAALLGHLGLALVNQPVLAETFRLDTCITDRPNDRPAAYLHVVTHGMADVIPSKNLME